MTSRGETSGARDEEFTDIQVDTERLIGYAPLSPVPSESEGDEDVRAEVAEPVWGGVLRSGGQDTDGDESEEDPTEIEPVQETAEEVPEEGSPIFHTYEEAPADENEPEDPVTDEDEPEDPVTEDDEPAEYADGMGTTASDIIEELTTRNEELEDRIRHLEEQNQTHQDQEDHYRDAAYEMSGMVTELKAELEQTGLDMATLQTERDAARAELQSVRGELALEGEIRDLFHDAWVSAATRVDQMEEQVRISAARVDAAGFALDTAIGRLRSRVRRFPREEDMSRQVISRRIVDRMAQQEYEDAARRIDQ